MAFHKFHNLGEDTRDIFLKPFSTLLSYRMKAVYSAGSGLEY